MEEKLIITDITNIKTPWGKINIPLKEFSFIPKFHINNPPISEDYHFVHETIHVLMSYNDEQNKWSISSITDNESYENLYLSPETLREIHTQGVIRINSSLDYIHINS